MVFPALIARDIHFAIYYDGSIIREKYDRTDLSWDRITRKRCDYREVQASRRFAKERGKLMAAKTSDVKSSLGTHSHKRFFTYAHRDTLCIHVMNLSHGWTERLRVREYRGKIAGRNSKIIKRELHSPRDLACLFLYFLSFFYFINQIIILNNCLSRWFRNKWEE